MRAGLEAVLTSGTMLTSRVGGSNRSSHQSPITADIHHLRSAQAGAMCSCCRAVARSQECHTCAMGACAVVLSLMTVTVVEGA